MNNWATGLVFFNHLDVLDILMIGMEVGGRVTAILVLIDAIMIFIVSGLEQMGS